MIQEKGFSLCAGTLLSLLATVATMPASAAAGDNRGAPAESNAFGPAPDLVPVRMEFSEPGQESTSPVSDTFAVEETELEALQPDQGDDPGTPGVTAGIAPEVERVEVFLRFKALFEDAEYDDALPLGRRFVDLTELLFGENDPELVTALVNLGSCEEMAGQYAAAELSYKQAIEIAEVHQGVFDQAMVRPLTGLGTTYIAMKRYEDAATALQRAKHITHREYGIYNLEQETIVDNLTETYIGMDDIAAADREQRFNYRASKHTMGANDPAITDAVMKLGDWYERTGRHTEARGLYKEAVTIIESNYGEDDLRLVPPLTSIARSHRNSRTLRREGEASLKRAVQIYEAREFADTDEYARALANLGDWYTMLGQDAKASEMYQQAWSNVQKRQSQRAEGDAPGMFTRPVRLTPFRPKPALETWEKKRIGFREIYVLLRFTVLANGKVDDVVVLEKNFEHALLVRDVVKSIRKVRFRPRIDQGLAVDTPNVFLRVPFELKDS